MRVSDSVMWGSHTYVCKEMWLFSLVNLSHVDLIIRLARRNLKGKGKFLPPPQLVVIVM